MNSDDTALRKADFRADKTANDARLDLIGDDEARLLWEFWVRADTHGDVTLRADLDRDNNFEESTDYAYTITGALKTLPPPKTVRAARSTGGGKSVKSQAAEAAQAVEIPDAALRSILEALLGKEADDAITKADLAKVVSLNLRGSGVADLGGLQHAINLTELYVDDFSLDLAPLRGLGLDVHVPGEEPLRVPSNDATLSSLTLSGVTIGAFAPATTDYTASVGNDVDRTTVSVTVNDGGATYVAKLGTEEDADGTVALAVGANTVSVAVTAEDGDTTKTYTVTVTRAPPPSNDATLSSMALSGVNFGAFNSATSQYTATVSHDVTETTVTATANDGGASYVIKLGGVEDADGTVDLAVGANVITIKVTAADGQTTKTYTVTVTRAEAPPSTDPAPPLTAEFQEAPQSHDGTNPFTFRIAFSEPISESYVTIRDHALEVAEGSVTGAWRVDQRSDLWGIRVQPDSDADVAIALPADRACDTQGAVCTEDGKALSNRPEMTVPGPAPANTPVNSPATGAPSISGTAQVGQTLTASTSGIADADGLSNAVFSYQWIANDGTTDTDISSATAATYTLADADHGKTIKVRVSFTDNGGNQESLTSRATGSVAPPASDDATLSNLELSGVNFGTFDSATTAYTASVANEVDQTTVTATTSDDGASYVVRLDGSTDPDGVISLSVGSNVITVEATAEDDSTTKTYTVTVTRADAPPSDDATLSALTLSGIDIGNFDSATTNYTASVGNDVDQTTVSATTTDGGATYMVKLGGTVDADGVIPLAVGDNSVSVVVTAEDGNTTRTYAVTVTRAEAEEEPTPDGPQGPPGNFTGEVIAKGQVALDWDDVAGATGYQVQFWTLREQLVLPNDDIGIVFNSSSATVSGLPDEASWSFKVSADGGEWSPGWLTLENPYH